MRAITPPAGWLRAAIVAAFVLATAFTLGWCTAATRAEAKHGAALRTAQHRSDSLDLALRLKVATVVRDTLWRDTVVTRWRVAKAESIPVLVPVPGRPETVTVAVPASALPVVRLADSTITGLEDANRRCVSVVLDCERTALAFKTRAEGAEAHAARLEAAAGRGARWRATERGACLASVATNLVQWRLSR